MRAGSTHSPETRAKMSAALMARWQKPGDRARMTAALVGRPCTAESRVKMSAAASKRTISFVPVAQCIIWDADMIAAYHAGMAAGLPQTRIANRIGVSVPAMKNAVKRGVFL